MAGAQSFKVGDWQVTPELNLIDRNGQTVRLEPQAMDVLRLLIVRAPDVVSIEELASEVWKGRAMGDGQIYRRITEIRAAFDDDARTPRYVETIPKRGYRLAVDVEPLPIASFVHARPLGRWKIATALIVLVTLSVILFLRLDDRRLDQDAVIAVLPFANTSEEAVQSFLGESIADELIHALSTAPGLTVIARTSSFSFANTDSDIAEIGARLGASVVLEGSARRRGDQLQVTAQLVDSATSRVIWSEAFDEPVADLISVEHSIALGVAERLSGPNVDMTRIRAALPPLADLSAYEYYLLGRQRMRSGRNASMIDWPRADADQAVAYFRRAIATDPEFARAYTSLADALLYRAIGGQGFAAAFETGIPSAISEEVLIAIDRALELAPDLADARISRGLAIRVLEGDRERALDYYREAIELNPNLVEAHYALGRGGTGEEAAAAMLKAAELAPMSADIHVWAGHKLGDIGQREQALRHYERAITLESPPSSALLIVSSRRHAEGRPDEAVRALEPFFAREGYEYDEPRIRGWLASYYLDLGDRGRVRELLGPREPREPLSIAYARLHFAFAEADESLVADILHELTTYDNNYLYALYEQLIGHSDHARAQYEAIALEEDFGTPPGTVYRWGYAPALNWALLHREAGDEERAAELLASVRQLLDDELLSGPSASGAYYYVLASLEAIEGDVDDALDALEQAITAGWTQHWYAERDPNLETLRNEPRFQALIAEISSEMNRLRLAM